MFLFHLYDDRSNPSKRSPILAQARELLQRRVGRYKLLRDHESSSSSLSSKTSRERSSGASEMLLGDGMGESQELPLDGSEGLTLQETAKLSLEFCILWFLANYFAAACLEYTTVASSTILGSTSSIWTLLCGALMRVERFTLRKFLGVTASLAGVVLISSIDVSGETDENRGSFPHKTPRELAIGDTMAFVSAAMYGFYAVFMKKRIGDESKVNMPLFFGLVGLFNILLLWPGLIILHLTKIETFEIPPTKRILTIVLVNSASSLVSDFCWAYSMLLTSPLIVTVGLSLTIPLSLVGQMVLDKQYSSALYWVGAGIMFIAFLIINMEGREDSEGEPGPGPGPGEQIPIFDQRDLGRQSFQERRDSLRSDRSGPRRDSIRSVA
jgi:solute carrier family 35 protein F5